MSIVNEKLIDRLNYKEYRTFLKKAIGLNVFLTMDSDVLEFRNTSDQKYRIKSININNKEKIVPIGYLYKNGNCILGYYCSLSIYKNKEFIDNEGNIYNVYNYFINLSDEYLFYLLLLSSNDYYYSEMITKSYNLENVAKSINTNRHKYGFIVGSGICFDLKTKSWNELIEDMKREIIEIKHVKESEINRLKDDIGNTPYVIPQINKDIDLISYLNTIYAGLYDNYNTDKLSLKRNNQIEKYSIYQIANFIKKQAYKNGTQTILTFNYDNYLEQVFRINFPDLHINTIFKYGVNKKLEGINIVHSHGFMPYIGRSELTDKSIVLSTFEYMETYKDSSSYGYKQLYRQLDLTNIIIGNSVADYEEQKVFRNHYKEHLSKYQYILTLKSNTDWMNGYKILFYLNLGIIPIFLNKYEDFSKFIKKLEQ